MRFICILLLLLSVQSCKKTGPGADPNVILADPDLFPYSDPPCDGDFANHDCVSSNIRIQTLFKDPVVTVTGTNLYQLTLTEKFLSDPIVLTVNINLPKKGRDTNLQFTDVVGSSLTALQISMQYYSNNYVDMISKTGYAHFRYLGNDFYELTWCDAKFYNALNMKTETASQQTVVQLP